MKYINKLNIDFNNWEEVDDEKEFNIPKKLLPIFNLFKKILIKNNLYNNFINNLKKSETSWKLEGIKYEDYFKKTPPIYWVINSFSWGDDENGSNKWLTIYSEWSIELIKSKLL